MLMLAKGSMVGGCNRSMGPGFSLLHRDQRVQLPVQAGRCTSAVGQRVAGSGDDRRLSKGARVVDRGMRVWLGWRIGK